MLQSVVIKSYSNGLSVHLSEEASFNELAQELYEKLQSSKAFFKNAKVAVSFEGKKLTDEEYRELVKIMEKAAEMTILYIIGKDEETLETFCKVVQKDAISRDEATGYSETYKSNVKKGERLEFKGNVILIGDIEPGATVIADGDVIILGGLYGSCVAGNDGDHKHYILTFDLNGERVRIAETRYYSKEHSRWAIKPKMNPKLVYISENEIVADSITYETVKKFVESIK